MRDSIYVPGHDPMRATDRSRRMRFSYKNDGRRERLETNSKLLSTTTSFIHDYSQFFFTFDTSNGKKKKMNLKKFNDPHVYFLKFNYE